MRLQDASHPKIGIVGGGPAGSFAALHLLDEAKKQDLNADILIFEPRNFNLPGPNSCNRCAGILSSRVLKGLDELGLSLPPRVVQSELHSYALHFNREVIPINQPDPSRRIVTVFRCGGPRMLQGEPLASLDAFLLNQACERGARHVPQRVIHICKNNKHHFITEEDDYQIDFLVLATGINSHPPLSPEYGYKPPHTEVMAQDEIVRPEDWPDGQVSAFFREPPGLKFGAIIPKNGYLNISLLGEDMTRDSVQDFITIQGLKGKLEYEDCSSLCGCNPRVAVSPARGYYGDGWVAVGDAAVSRLYKDGIGSAFYTAQRAMTTALQNGISTPAFRKHYRPYCQRIARDNRYGRWMYTFWDFIVDTPWLLDTWIRTLTAEMDHEVETQAHIRLVWGMFTGDECYRDLFRMGMNPRALKNFLFPPQ